MTTPAPIPAAEATSSMVNPSDTAPEAATDQAQARVSAATVVRPSLRAQVAENPLLSFFGLVIVALLTAAIVGPHIRIDDTNERIDRFEDKVDASFDEVDASFDRVEARFDKLEAAIAEIDRKLTALIAHLNATAAVDDALAGRLTGPSAPGASGTGDDESG